MRKKNLPTPEGMSSGTFQVVLPVLSMPPAGEHLVKDTMSRIYGLRDLLATTMPSSGSVTLPHCSMMVTLPSVVGSQSSVIVLPTSTW